jgi:uncharacterized protein (DUF1330 family)
MAKKGYWIVCYQSVSDEAVVPEYGKLARPLIDAAGGRAMVAGRPAKTHEAGLDQRTVVIEFESVEKAIAVHESEGYQAALKVLGNAAKRDFRIVEGV